MLAFIVRPFGTKQEVDFDKVDELLIQPALKQLGIPGSTTASIMEQGNIREDMFAQLLLADLVIADLSIHNANVFYELGIRHALRDKKTFLIRCKKDEIPFDLKTDRYLDYPANDPAAALNELISGLKATMLSEKADSPVFYMLPKLEAQNPEKLLVIPAGFGEEVELAKAGKQAGKLSLLASEAGGFAWEMPALRSVAEALFQLKDFEASGMFWEKVRDRYANDLEANDRLATIYQRLAESEANNNAATAMELLTKSDLAIERLLTNSTKLDSNKKAEIFSLKGRNAKARWIDTWKNSPDHNHRKKALQSTFLLDAYKEYERAFNEDLNHFYSGINALGLLTTIISLAETMPDIWVVEFDADDEAAEVLRKYKARSQKLAVIVQASIEAKRSRTPASEKQDAWVNMTEADLACLTSLKPLRVGGLYQKIIDEASDLNFESAKRQLLIYQELGVQTENVKAALEAFVNSKVFEDDTRHYLLFTGHMIDKPGRTEPRFPPTKEANVKAAIREVVMKEKEKHGNNLKGIAGGACGGDILFHEVCVELGIDHDLYLALPRELFIQESVDFAGSHWVDRFDELYRKIPRRILSATKELPKWLQKINNYSIWERNNLWMLNSALSCGGIQMTLVSVWDGKGGDGAGGTEHMVKQAKKRGAKIIILDINTL